MDALRGVMMLLGIVFHSAVSFLIYPVQEFWPYKFSENHVFFDVLLTLIHLFRIPVFFIIAGYFMSMQLDKYGGKQAALKRIKRIVVPFIFSMLFLAPWVSYGFGVLAYGETWHGLNGVRPYLLLPKSGTVHFWFLYYLIFYNLIHILYAQFLAGKTKYPATSDTGALVRLFLIQVIILFVFGNQSIHGDYSFLPAVGSVLYFLMYYLFGIWAYRHYDTFVDWTTITFRKMLIALGLLPGYLSFRDHERYFSQGIWHYFESILTISVAFSLILVIFGLFRKFFSQEQKWAQAMAKASYTIYLIHLPILVWLLYIFRNKVANPFLFFGLLMILTTLSSVLVYLILDWLKITKRL